MEDLIKAQHYREQAENLRRLAEAFEDPAKREEMLAVARNYDNLSARFAAAG